MARPFILTLVTAFLVRTRAIRLTIVMAGLVPAIHGFLAFVPREMRLSLITIPNPC